MERKKKKTHCFDHLIEVALRSKDAARPADDPVTIRNESSTLRGAAFENVQNMPDIVHGEFRFAYAHAEAKQRRFALRFWLLGVRYACMRR